ncbi:hypothetical protein BDW75DRAFT_214316 [Aspergillus navahoensis]
MWYLPHFDCLYIALLGGGSSFNPHGTLRSLRKCRSSLGKQYDEGCMPWTPNLRVFRILYVNAESTQCRIIRR